MMPAWFQSVNRQLLTVGQDCAPAALAAAVSVTRIEAAVLRERKPLMLVESKWSEERPSPDLACFGERLGVAERIQVAARLREESSYKGIRVMPACALTRPVADLP